VAEGGKRMSQTPPKPPHLLFSDDERRQIVRNFVEAYLANEVQLDWPTKEHFLELSKQKLVPKSVRAAGEEEAVELESYGKNRFNDWVETATGFKTATYEEVESAISGLFENIVLFRMGDRIRGSFFYGTNVERRLKDLEDKVVKFGRVIEEIHMAAHLPSEEEGAEQQT
jgi:hypothetical protein